MPDALAAACCLEVSAQGASVWGTLKAHNLTTLMTAMEVSSRAADDRLKRACTRSLPRCTRRHSTVLDTFVTVLDTFVHCVQAAGFKPVASDSTYVGTFFAPTSICLMSSGHCLPSPRR